MRNPIYALAILLTIALAALMTGCDISDPSPSWTTDYYLIDTEGNELAYLFPSGGKTNVRVTADGQYAFYMEDGNFTRFCVETGDTQIFELPFDEQFYFDYWPSYDMIYLKMPIGGLWNIYSLDVLTGEVHALTTTQMNQTTTYSVEYDRNEIYYVTNIDSVSTIRRLDLATGVDDSLKSISIGRYEYPAVAPDGCSVYYLYTVEGNDVQMLYRYCLTSHDENLVSSAISSWDLSIGQNEEFLIHSQGYAYINENFELFGSSSIGSDCTLMANREDIVYRNYGGRLVYKNMVSSDEFNIGEQSYLNHWVSSEGYLVAISKSTIVD